MLRSVRKWVTGRATNMAVALAPRVPSRSLDQAGALLARVGPHVPVLASRIERSMRSAGVYAPGVLEAYFRQVGMHVTGALHAMHSGANAPAAGPADHLRVLAHQRVTLDPRFDEVRERNQAGEGVVLMAPHIAGYLVQLARLAADISLTVYLRHSRDRRRRAAKERWYRASGVDWIAEPARDAGPLGRVGRMAGTVRAARTVFITPDLPQKRGGGVSVRLLGRDLELPAGPALLSLRTRAPLYVVVAEERPDRQHLLLRGPFEPVAPARGATSRQQAIQQRMQWFADEMTAFVRENPALWYLWGDKRWAAVFCGDPRYVCDSVRGTGRSAAVSAAPVNQRC